MTNVTVELTQEESNFLNYFLEKVRADCERTAFKIQDIAEESLNGDFGPALRGADEGILNSYVVAEQYYTELRDKFPVDTD